MAIEIKEVSSKRDLKSFIYFPFWLYNGNKYWVPSLIKDDNFAFDKNKNPFYEGGDSRLYLVYKDRRIAGRVAVLAKHDELEAQQKMLFGWLDFEDDREVSRLLFEAIEESARELKATTIKGPVRFNNRINDGILTEGFQEPPTFGSPYNAPYYHRHLEAWAYTREHDLVEFKLPLQDAKFEQSNNPIEIQQADLKVSPGTKKELADFYSKSGSTYKSLMPFIPTENITAVKDRNNKTVALSVVLPSFAKSIQRAKGHLSILANLLFILDKKQFKNGELHLHFANEASQKELAPFLISKAILFCKAKNIATLTSNPILESSELENIWKNFGATQTKRRRVYSKSLSN